MSSYYAKLPAWLRSRLGGLARAVRQFQSRLVSRYLGDNVVAILVETRNGRFLVDPKDMGVGRRLVQDGEYGTDEIALIGQLTNNTSRVLVVGSHVGAIAIPLAKTVEKVTAIEANPKTFRLLLANIHLNGTQNISPVEIAASDTKEPIQFIMSTVNSGGSKRMPIEKLQRYFFDKPQVVTVNAERLDDMLYEDFDVIIMDLEGSEYFALRGMRRILAKARHLIVEFVPHHITSVAGVAVADFVAVLEPYFDELFIPSLQVRVSKDEFLAKLSAMHRDRAWDDGVVFSKVDVPSDRHVEVLPPSGGLASNSRQVGQTN